MKKLIITAAIAFAAIASQASVANWKVTAGNMFDGSGSTESSAKYSGTVWIFGSQDISQASLYAAYAADSKYDFSAKSLGSLTMSNGSIPSSANTFQGGVAGNTYDVYMVVVDTDKIYFSNIKEGITASESSTAPGTAAFSTQNNGSSTFSSVAPSGSGFAGAGHWSAVPEPTSGLLLLLGMAGLALRRRRA